MRLLNNVLVRYPFPTYSISLASFMSHMTTLVFATSLIALGRKDPGDVSRGYVFFCDAIHTGESVCLMLSLQ